MGIIRAESFTLLWAEDRTGRRKHSKTKKGKFRFISGNLCKNMHFQTKERRFYFGTACSGACSHGPEA
jgi:hypothetical protein